MVKLKQLILVLSSLCYPNKHWTLKILSTMNALLFLSPLFLQAQIAETVISRNFEPVSGNQLLIRFTVPNSGNDFTYNLHSAYLYTANGSKFTIESYSGDQLKLASGDAYEILWDVLRDTDELEEPERIEINLEYTPASRVAVAELENGGPQEYDTQTKQQVIFDQEPVEHREEQAPIEHNVHVYKRKHRPGLRLGLLGHAGYVNAQLSNGNEDIKYDFGYGYGLATFLEIRMGGSTYLQLEGAYAVRNFEFNNFGFFQTSDGCKYLYNIEEAELSFTDYRIAARMKFGILQLGAYYSFLQEADRSGQMNYQVNCSNGFYSEINEENLEYSLLDHDFFPEDRRGNRAVKSDYGLSIGIESVPRNNFIIGIGVDYSLSNLINNDYEQWEGQDSRDLFPAQTIDLKLAYAYLRLGFRI